MVKAFQCIFGSGVTPLHPLCKSSFQGVVLRIMKPQKMNKVQQVGGIKGAVLKMQKGF